MENDSGYDERLSMLRNYVDADPENDAAHTGLGKVLLEGGDAASAEKSLRRALEINPGNGPARRWLGRALLESGKRDEAVALLNDGVVQAHARGDHASRNAMQALLRSIGVDPPDPVRADLERRGLAAGTFVCSRCGAPNARLAGAPVDTPLGKRIGETICESCWEEWMRASVRLINEYRLNLATEEGGTIYDRQLREFLGLEEG